MSSAFCYRCRHRMLVASHRLFKPPPHQSRWTHAEAPPPHPRTDTLGELTENAPAPDPSSRRPKAAESQSRSTSTEDQHLQDLFKSAGARYTSLTAEEEKSENVYVDPITQGVPVKMSQGSWEAVAKVQSTARDTRFKKHAGDVPLKKHAASNRLRNSHFRSLVANAPDLEEVKRLWRVLEIQARQHQEPTMRYMHNSLGQGVDGHIDVNCYEAVIRAFAAYGEFGKMLEVWDALLQSGRLIPVHTWAALMRGISKSRDWKAFERIWQESIAQGVVADEQMWICRLNLLVKNQQWRLAIEALSTFHRAPAKAMSAKSQVSHNETIQPINLVNPVLRELLRSGQHEDVKEIFTWAESVGFKANTTTVNQFIHAASQKDGLKAGLRGLDAFRQRNLVPDAATISILLSAFTREESNSSQMSHKDQHVRVIEILTELEKRGLEITKYTYSILISFLSANNNIDATRHVLAHMKARQVEPSLEACTTIATFYLRQDPIDFTALDELLEGMRSRNQNPDQRFCGRMIEGYAAAGKIGRMMSVLQESERRSFFPQVHVLQKVFDALEAANELEILNQFTTDAVHRRGLFRNYDPRRHGRGNYFWDGVDGFQKKGYATDSL